jgi:hypothetical protein
LLLWRKSADRDRDKARLALNNITAGVREREDANRTREAGHLDEIQGAVANTLNLQRTGAVGFIDWLDASRNHHAHLLRTIICLQART